MNRFSSSELAQMDAGSWFSEAYAGEPVPLYEQVARFCKDNGIWMNVEIKPAPGDEHETGTAVALCTQKLFAAQIADAHACAAALPLFSSFSPTALAAARLVAPGIPRGLLVDRVPGAWSTRLEELGATALHVNHRHVREQQVHEIRESGYSVFCYTVNSIGRARQLFEWGVDAICTDRLDLFGTHQEVRR